MFIKQLPELRIFLIKIVKFLLPFIFLMSVLEYFAYRSGELWSLDKVIYFQGQARERVLFNRKVIDDEIPEYKFKNVLEKKPKVLVLGSSRAMQFREEMFASDANFYNAAGMVHNLGDVLDFIKNLPNTPEHNPKTILLNLDFYWFGNKREIDNGLTKALNSPNPVYQWESHLYAFRHILFNIFSSENILSRILTGRDKFSHTRSIGLQALDGNGFRPDGSYQYGLYLEELRRVVKYRDRGNFFSRLERGESPFYANSEYDTLRVKVLEDFLRECNRRNIEVFGFAAPVSSELLVALNNSGSHRDLLVNFQKNIPEIFQKHGFNFFDFSSLDSLRLDNISMFDAFHPTETVTAKMLLKMSANSKLKLILADDLSERLTNSKNALFELGFDQN